MEKRVQQKKAAPGIGVNLSRPKSVGKPQRSPEMNDALQRSRYESQEFASGVLSFRLEQEPLDQLAKQANLLGLSAGQLARSWIIERLNQPKVAGLNAEQHAQMVSLIQEITVKTLKDMRNKSAK